MNNSIATALSLSMLKVLPGRVLFEAFLEKSVIMPAIVAKTGLKWQELTEIFFSETLIQPHHAELFAPLLEVDPKDILALEEKFNAAMRELVKATTEALSDDDEYVIYNAGLGKGVHEGAKMVLWAIAPRKSFVKQG